MVRFLHQGIIYTSIAFNTAIIMAWQVLGVVLAEKTKEPKGIFKKLDKYFGKIGLLIFPVFIILMVSVPIIISTYKLEALPEIEKIEVFEIVNNSEFVTFWDRDYKNNTIFVETDYQGDMVDQEEIKNITDKLQNFRLIKLTEYEFESNIWWDMKEFPDYRTKTMENRYQLTFVFRDSEATHLNIIYNDKEIYGIYYNGSDIVFFEVYLSEKALDEINQNTKVNQVQ